MINGLKKEQIKYYNCLELREIIMISIWPDEDQSGIGMLSPVALSESAGVSLFGVSDLPISHPFDKQKWPNVLGHYQQMVRDAAFPRVPCICLLKSSSNNTITFVFFIKTPIWNQADSEVLSQEY